VASLIGIALAVTGLGAMPKVVEEMKQAEKLYRDLDLLQRSPVSRASIEAETERIEQVVADNERVISRAAVLYGYQPLVEDVFPEGDTDARFRFLRRYNTAMLGLMDSLRWGSLPTESEIGHMSERIDEEHFRSLERGLDRGAVGSEQRPTGDRFTSAGVLTKVGARTDAEARASMASAQQIYCYAVTFSGAKSHEIPSLYFHPYMEDTGTLEPPTMEDCWWAQIGYWIQKDVVDAIVAVNDAAAAAAKERGEDRWIGIMPVKDVISIRLSDEYVVADEEDYVGATAGGYGEALPSATANTVFTKSVTSPAYEVIQFTVKLVMDQRDIPRLVDRICRNRFHTLLRIGYEAVPANRQMRGKIYGSDPTVNVVLDFETIMLGDVFRRLMPTVICDNYEEIDCPEPETAEDEEEGD
jgi:hypothetical protein